MTAAEIGDNRQPRQWQQRRRRHGPHFNSQPAAIKVCWLFSLLLLLCSNLTTNFHANDDEIDENVLLRLFVCFFAQFSTKSLFGSNTFCTFKPAGKCAILLLGSGLWQQLRGFPLRCHGIGQQRLRRWLRAADDARHGNGHDRLPVVLFNDGRLPRQFNDVWLWRRLSVLIFHDVRLCRLAIFFFDDGRLPRQFNDGRLPRQFNDVRLRRRFSIFFDDGRLSILRHGFVFDGFVPDRRRHGQLLLALLFYGRHQQPWGPRRHERAWKHGRPRRHERTWRHGRRFGWIFAEQHVEQLLWKFDVRHGQEMRKSYKRKEFRYFSLCIVFLLCHN